MTARRVRRAAVLTAAVATALVAPGAAQAATAIEYGLIAQLKAQAQVKGANGTLRNLLAHDVTVLRGQAAEIVDADVAAEAEALERAQARAAAAQDALRGAQGAPDAAVGLLQ